MAPTYKIERRTLDSAAYTLDVKANLGKSGEKIDLPMDRWIKTIRLMLEIDYSTSAASTLNEDNPMSLLGNVAVLVNGKAIRDLPFSMLHYKNIYKNYGAVPPRQKTIAAGAVNNKKAVAVADFAFCTEPSFPNSHPKAIDALLPAHELSSLAIRVDIGQASDLGTNMTINTATLHTMLEEVVMSFDDAKAIYGNNREKLTIIQESVAEKALTAANNYQFETDLPTGNILVSNLMKAIDNSVRSDSIISSFRTVVKQLGIEDQWSWKQAQIDDRIGLKLGSLSAMGELEASSESGIVHTIKGLVFNDYRDLGYLNLRGQRTGAAKTQFNVNAPTPTSKIVEVREEWLSAAEAVGVYT